MEIGKASQRLHQNDPEPLQKNPEVARIASKGKNHAWFRWKAENGYS
jgi:hypothetical protein